VIGSAAGPEPVATERDAAISPNCALVGGRQAQIRTCQIFPLADAGAALTALLLRRYAGKVVLET
jgi:hypothetical protein